VYKPNKLLIVLTTIMLFALTIPVLAAPTVTLDGKQLSFEVAPVIENGSTLVPLRAIFEAMGATVNWDDATQTATAIKGNTTVILKIGSTSPTINGQIKKLDVPAKIINGRTLAPLRFVGEAFGGKVGWDQATEKITISGKSDTYPSVTPSNQSPAQTITQPTQQNNQTDTVYVTKTGKKYHRAGCRSLSDSAIPMSLTEAKAAGYEPCSICNP